MDPHGSSKPYTFQHYIQWCILGLDDLWGIPAGIPILGDKLADNQSPQRIFLAQIWETDWRYDEGVTHQLGCIASVMARPRPLQSQGCSMMFHH